MAEPSPVNASPERRAFIQFLGGAAAGAMSASMKADALEHHMLSRLPGAERTAPTAPPPDEHSDTIRAGTGRTFGDGLQKLQPLRRMPERPTLIDFFSGRFGPERNHCLQSAAQALKHGQPEERVLACLLHDVTQCLMCVDHGWWGAQMLEPYVPERVSWAIRYHQALRFFPDASVGYSYPAFYVELFGPNYVPEPYIQEAYRYARNHPWYMDARTITVYDIYSFDPRAEVSIEPFKDIIGRHFRQPNEGLGFDGSPTAHMWRSLIFPDHPL